MNHFVLLYSTLLTLLLMTSCDKDEDFIDLPPEPNPELVEKGDEVGIKISKYMDQASPGVSLQGAACYGDYLFQFENYNSNVYIYNLKSKKFIEKVSLKPNSNNHCNNASFSDIFYDLDNEFPLLYVSGGLVSTYNHAQVYRIVHNEDGFIIEKVQEIEFPKASTDNKMHSTQVVMADDYMYVLTKGSNQTFVSKFEIPDYNLSSVLLTDEDIIEQYEVDDYIHKQGAVIKDGLMYVMYGVPAWGDTNYLRVLDLNKYEDSFIINISKLGFKQEFEGLAFYNGTLIAATNNNAGIFVFHFKNPIILK